LSDLTKFAAWMTKLRETVSCLNLEEVQKKINHPVRSRRLLSWLQRKGAFLHPASFQKAGLKTAKILNPSLVHKLNVNINIHFHFRLPTLGSGPTSSRSPSFTNLKTNIRRESTAQSQAGLQRERSFIEKNFVETLKHPQVQVNFCNSYFVIERLKTLSFCPLGSNNFGRPSPCPCYTLEKTYAWVIRWL